jgi:copper chaperone CopZ
MIKSPWLLLALGLLAPLASHAADYSLTLSNVHLCCNSCVKDANAAVTPAMGASAAADKASRTIKITASSQASAQKAVDALVAAGFYGEPSDPKIQMGAVTAPDAHVHSLKVSGVHLCCNKCVSTVNKTVAKVPGVKGTTASKDADSYEITGDFNAREAVNALTAAGFAAKVD